MAVRRQGSAKRWCYTLNNPTLEPAVSEELYVYHVYGKEVGESGTPHYQGFIIFKDKLSLTSLKVLIPRAHYEVAKGKNKQAADYCKKDGDYKEFGVLPEEPSVKGGEALKERYETAFKQAKCGDLDSIDTDLLIKHYRTLKQIRIDYVNELPPLDQTAGIWIYGDSGVGKSSYARKTYPGAYVKNCNEWWDGYQQQNTVIIDDFYGWIKYDEILKICDRYPYQVPIKGGYEQFTSKRIIITSNEPIENWYKGDWYKEEQLKALKRRIDIYEYFMLLNNECIRSDLLFEINDTI